MKKLFLLFALVLTVGMNAWAGYVATDYLNNNSHTYIEKMPTLTDPSMCIHIFQRDPDNGEKCVTWGGYENKDANILPKILIDGVDFAQPGWELCWLNNDPDNGVDTWWDAKDSDCHIYTKEINGVTWTLRFYNPRKMHECYYVYMYFCPSEIEGGSKHTITVKGRLTEYVAKNTPSTTNYLDVERDFVFDMPKLITSDPIVFKENTNELSFYGNLAAGAEKSTYFGVYVNDGTVNGFVPYDQLDGKQELAYATTFSNIKYTIPEEFEGKDLRGQMHRDFTGLLDGMVSVCHYYGRFNAAANAIHYEETEPTYTTFGYSQECWKNPATGIIYSDIFFENELNPAQVLTYAKFITNPVTANNGFTLKEDATYDDVKFNWAAETTYNASDTGTRSVEFTVYGKDVANARLKWTKDYDAADYGRFTITVYVNGEQKYSVNQNNGESLGGYFAVPLQGLNSYDVVKFEVKKTESASESDAKPTITACLEYTSSNGGERVIIHHEAVEPTYETTGTIEYWEEKEIGKYYSDAACTKELSPAQVLTYAKFITCPVTANTGFTIKDATYDGMQFNWAAETTYTTANGIGICDRGTRSVEFTVFGTDVANARVKWNKNSGAYQYGQFTITVYVNGKQKYSVNQDDLKSLSGIFIVPLEELKVDDVVKFEIKKPSRSAWAGSVTIAACLEYTSSNGGAREVIHHEAVEPTYETTGNIEYWEDEAVKKLFSDAECINEVELEQVIAYQKLTSTPVTANNGFTIKDATYKGVPFNWAAETTYNVFDTGTRSVEFTVYGTGVANAHVKWTKNYGDYLYGRFTISVYVNDIQIKSINQGNTNLEGIFAVPLPDLKTGDRVRFEVKKTDVSDCHATVMISACLEYTRTKECIATIVPDVKQKIIGTTDPVLTWHVIGDTGELELPTVRLSREQGEDPGTYTIHAYQSEDDTNDYPISFLDGVFHIIEGTYHEMASPTFRTFGFTQDCWEVTSTGKLYDDQYLVNELSPAQVITYKKLISNPVTANSGFTLKEDAKYEGAQFNWAAETIYNTFETGTRSVEFTVFGTDVANARVKWTKNYKEAIYGRFTISVYVNGVSVYSVNQNNGESLGGYFAVPLQGLNSYDVVKFEVSKPNVADRNVSSTIAACLEYTSSNGGEVMLITANQDPDHTENYYSTFWSSTGAYQVPEGVTAYTGKVEDSTSEPNTSVLKLTAIEDGIIPASQGVILRMTTEDNSATKQQIALVKTTATGTWSGTNALMGTDEATTLGANQYALSLGQNGVGFYLWEGKEIGANKAYLTLSGSAGAKAFIFQFDDDPTGIESLTPALSEGEGAAYNLNGVRVDDNYKGIVIKNGKKIYQK